MDKKTLLYQSDTFSVYADSVIQGDNKAVVVSPTEIKSNYLSPASATFSRKVLFKFSINEKDNELPPGQDHWVVIHEGNESPVITFGEKPTPAPEAPPSYLPPNYRYTFRVDMSPVLNQFRNKGYYETYDGTRIAQADFKGFFIAGNAEPLSWDFVNLQNKGLKLEQVGETDIYTITVTLNPYQAPKDRERTWQMSADVTNKPRLTTDIPLIDALYNLSLEEAQRNIEPDSTLRTGAKWGGVWTRDVSYSTVLAFAWLEPEVAKNSLRKKVTRQRIVQDTGSGGAWPVSSDRTTWVLAAWEIFKVTGDTAWLNEVYPIIKNTLEDDRKTVYDPVSGLYSGESSFLDWREQTYPKWMDNVDIYSSFNLGTNVVHSEAHRIFSEMSNLKGDTTLASLFADRATALKAAINTHLWNQEKGYYSQYLYGRGHLLESPRFEALGEALAVLFQVADSARSAQIIASSPVTPYGVTCIYPQIPGIPPYHNNGIWPFVQAFFNLASAEAGNEKALTHGIASIYRAAALFLSNYENMVAETGDFKGTEINSDRMLWSMAGNIAMVSKVFMGIRFETDGLHLNPVVPEAFSGVKRLENFRYGDAILDLTVIGHGNKTKWVTINDRKMEKAFIPRGAEGEIKIMIKLDDEPFPGQTIHEVRNEFSLSTVNATLEDGELLWPRVEGATAYKVFKNGQEIEEIRSERYAPGEEGKNAFYQVMAIDGTGKEGFASAPVAFEVASQFIEMETWAPASEKPYTNFTGDGFVEVSLNENKDIRWEVLAEEEGWYWIDFRYSNGSGPWNTDNKCAIRSLDINGNYQGVMVFAQRGTNEWSDWGYSNRRRVKLTAGINTFRLYFAEWNQNMNGEINTAMLDQMRLIRE